ncbi:MAG: ATP-binding cassette domain-containing protein, partial [Dehalococcoidia bacterium]|nr:ATP-binding cassette domain-containing protein [Dehalococcoidia bacterium]
MSQPVVEATDLTKVYGDVTAVDHLNLRINEGEVFGFLGPNGAGKTTTILMLLGLTEPTSGSVRVCGFNPTREPLKVKRVVGYFPERIGFYNNLTAR